MEGVLLYLVNANGTGGTIRITDPVLIDIANGNLSTAAGWIVMIVVGGAGRRGHRSAGTVTAGPADWSPHRWSSPCSRSWSWPPPASRWSWCATPTGARCIPVQGVPYVVLDRPRGPGGCGRSCWAAPASAATSTPSATTPRRPAGPASASDGTSCGRSPSPDCTAGIAGVVYASRLGSISNNIDGGTLVLYAVASAVIGGASLFGGRGKMVYALLGGLVIATIYNGMGLLGLAAVVPVHGHRPGAAGRGHHRLAGPPGAHRGRVSGTGPPGRRIGSAGERWDPAAVPGRWTGTAEEGAR